MRRTFVAVVPSVRIETDRTLEWWRPLVQWALAIPHVAYLGALTAGAGLAAVAVGATVLATRRVPPPLARFQVFTLRQRVRTYSYLWLLRRSSPPFATRVVADDPGDDPKTEVSMAVPSEAARSAPLVRPLAMVPHGLVLIPVGVLLDLLYPLLALSVALRRGWAPAAADSLVALERWVVALLAYVLLVADERPAFGLRAHTVATTGRAGVTTG